MQCAYFNGVLKEVCEQYPNIDLAGYLADKLQLPLDKAEALAARIEKQVDSIVKGKEKQKTVRLFQKAGGQTYQLKNNTYPLDCLVPEEFGFFIKWLLDELGFEIQSEMLTATDLGVDVVACKGDDKVAVQAVLCPRTHRVSESIVSLMKKIRGDCAEALVIATAYFTEQAKVEAEKWRIELWDIECLNNKIQEAKSRAEKIQSKFPNYKGTLLNSLWEIEKTKLFLFRDKGDQKYDVHLPGIRYPLLTFQVESGVIARCVFRIKYNEPVNENEGEVLITTNEMRGRVDPSEEKAYGLIIRYLEQFLE